MSKHQRGECWSQLGHFPGIYCVWYIPWFPHSESMSSFLLALQFPVTMTKFYRAMGGKALNPAPDIDRGSGLWEIISRVHQRNKLPASCKSGFGDFVSLIIPATRKPFNETPFPNRGKSVWLLKTSIIGNYCISYPKGQFSTQVGDLTCLGQKFYNDTSQKTQWWRTPNHTEPQLHLLANFSDLQAAWDNLTANIDWQSPSRLCWICGKQAYTVLPSRWFGSCVLGTIWPSFFLLPLTQGEKLRVSIYEEKVNRKRQGALWIGIGKIINGLLSQSFNTMVPSLSRRWIRRLSHPDLYDQLHYSVPGSSWNYN
jgi:hypothetical protein